MSRITPSTSSIHAAIITQLQAALNTSIPLLPKAFERVLAKTLAGVFVLLYKYAGFSLLQMFVRTASFDEIVVNGQKVRPLLELARLTRVGDPAPGRRAELSIAVTVEAQVGSLPAGTQLLGAINGVTYLTKMIYYLNAPSVNIDVIAYGYQNGGDGVGAIGNLEAGSVISFAQTPPAVARDAVVNNIIVPGADAEPEDVYRKRVIDYFQQRPQGGAYADYKLWAEEVQGVLNVYPYTSDLPGQVEVYVESSTDVDGIPDTQKLTEVLDSINFNKEEKSTRRPLGALVNTYPISRREFDVKVTALIAPNLQKLQADITVGVTDYLKLAEPYIPGLSIPPRRDRITRSALSGVVDQIVSAGGGVFGNVLLIKGGAAIDVYHLNAGEKAKLNLIEYR